MSSGTNIIDSSLGTYGPKIMPCYHQYVQKLKLQFHLKLKSKHVKWSHSNETGRKEYERFGPPWGKTKLDMHRSFSSKWSDSNDMGEVGRRWKRLLGPPGGKTKVDMHRSGEQRPPGETMPVINKGWQSELSINTVSMAWANLPCKQTNSWDFSNIILPLDVPINNNAIVDSFVLSLIIITKWWQSEVVCMCLHELNQSQSWTNQQQGKISKAV